MSKKKEVDMVPCSCGAKPRLVKIADGTCLIYCDKCGDRTCKHSSEEGAIKEWNAIKNYAPPKSLEANDIKAVQMLHSGNIKQFAGPFVVPKQRHRAEVGVDFGDNPKQQPEIRKCICGKNGKVYNIGKSKIVACHLQDGGCGKSSSVFKTDAEAIAYWNSMMKHPFNPMLGDNFAGGFVVKNTLPKLTAAFKEYSFGSDKVHVNDRPQLREFINEFTRDEKMMASIKIYAEAKQRFDLISRETVEYSPDKPESYEAAHKLRIDSKEYRDRMRSCAVVLANEILEKLNMINADVWKR
jgi:hypothetical protein